MKLSLVKIGSLAGFSLLLGAVPALASGSNIRCNNAQTYCEIKTNRLTIGDSIGIVNEYKEIVARGVIVDMEGSLRKVQIEESHGDIKKSHRVATLGTDFHPETAADFRQYSQPERMAIGGGTKISNLVIGNGALAYGFEGAGQMHYKGPFYLTARAGLLMAESDAGREKGNVDNVGLPSAVNIITAMPGVAYIHRASAPVSFKAEAGLGFGYVVGDVAGDSTLSNYEIGITEGAGLALSLKAGVTARYKKIVPEANLEFFSANDATSFGFSLGAMMEIK